MEKRRPDRITLVEFDLFGFSHCGLAVDEPELAVLMLAELA
jgi:hypothetical protein